MRSFLQWKAKASMLLLGTAFIAGCASDQMPSPSPRLADLTLLERGVLVSERIEIDVLDADGVMPERIIKDEIFQPGRYMPVVPRVEHVGTDDLDNYLREVGYYGIVHAYPMYQFGAPLVRRVIPDSPADKAGLGAGDGVYLMQINNKDITTNEDILAFGSPSIGETISFEACRNAGPNASDCPDLEGTMRAEALPSPYRVRVHVSGRDDPLYGRLAFFPVFSTADGSANRIYRLEIPQEYIERARGGNVSVVYQHYTADSRNPASSVTGSIRPTGGTIQGTFVSWALWLSDVPL